MLREAASTIEQPETPRTPEIIGGLGSQAISGHEATTIVNPITAALEERMIDLESEFDLKKKSDETWENKDKKLEGLISVSAANFLAGRITASEFARIGDFSVSMLDQVRSDETRAVFKKSANALDEVFSWHEIDSLATPEQDVRRTETLMYYGGEFSKAHKRFVAKHGDALIAEPTKDNAVVQSLWKNVDFADYMGDRFKEFTDQYDGGFSVWPDKEKELLRHTFSAFGFSNEERKGIHLALYSFNVRKNPKITEATRAKRLQETIIIMARLERLRPGASHDVYKRFGIRNFFRYPDNILYRQLKYFEAVEAGEKPKKLLRLAVTATHDHNGSFDKPVEDVGTTRPVYMEANGLGELARALIKTKKVGLISALIVGGHGSPSAIFMGAKKASGIIRQSDLQKSLGMKRIGSKKIFTDNPKIFLLSCSGGAKGGIAQDISKITKTKVIAYPGVGSGGIRLSEAGDSHILRYINMGSRSSSIKHSLAARLTRKSKNQGVIYDSGKKVKDQTINISE